MPEEQPAAQRGDQQPEKPGGYFSSWTPLHWLMVGLLLVAVVAVAVEPLVRSEEISFSEFQKQLAAGKIAEVTIRGRTQLVGKFRKPDGAEDGKTADDLVFRCSIPPQLGQEWIDSLLAEGIVTQYEEPAAIADLLFFATTIAILLLLVFGWSMMRRSRDPMMGGGMLGGVTRSPARKYDAEQKAVTFDDVAGLEGVKKDLEEIVQFLKEPEKFHQLGARVPKGVLLMGPPGTGKTLLARAVAGEAGVAFYSINGSEFIQLFVGVGAGRVRDMFKTAKENSPAILFIDEIDAVGRQRGAGLGGGHDEREQTLNQILSEMDGFSQTSTVIVLAATNRPDVLDPALLRPGRFDRQVTVDRPTIEGRRELFELHSRGVPVAEDVEMERLARGTVGLTGADIRNLVNEAALWASRHDQSIVRMDDFEYARDKVLMGALRDDVLSDEEKLICAYHEAGHTLLAWLLPHSDKVHKVTIVPRGRALGVTQLVPDEDRKNVSEAQIEATLAMSLAGRAAERIRFDEYSAGAESDLQRATSLARRMVTKWGMSERLGPVAFNESEDHPFLGKEIVQEHRLFSEHTARVIDEEVSRILHDADETAARVLTDEREKLDSLADALLEQEIVDTAGLEEILGPPVGAEPRGAAEPAAAHRLAPPPQPED
ncbi:MAG: ATP-dependent zinc metalloprotease FtsH [Planctomycetota bacterium]